MVRKHSYKKDPADVHARFRALPAAEKRAVFMREFKALTPAEKRAVIADFRAALHGDAGASPQARARR